MARLYRLWYIFGGLGPADLQKMLKTTLMMEFLVASNLDDRNPLKTQEVDFAWFGEA